MIKQVLKSKHLNLGGKELILFHWEMIMKLLCEIYIFNEVNIYGIKYFKGIINSEYLV